MIKIYIDSVILIENTMVVEWAKSPCLAEKHARFVYEEKAHENCI